MTRQNKETMKMDKLTTTIYKTPNCPRCRELAAYLTQLGVDFDEQDMSSSEVLTDLRCEGVFVMEAPVLRVGTTYHNTNILWNGNRLAPWRRRTRRGGLGPIKSKDIKRMTNIIMLRRY
jgi:glutaredoxin